MGIQQEKKQEKKLEKKKVSYWRVLGYFLWKYKEKKWSAISITLIKIAISISGLFPIIYLKDLINLISQVDGSPSPEIMHQSLGILIMIVGIRFLIWILRRIIDFLLINFEIYLMKSIYLESFSYLHKHSYNFFANAFSGSLVKKVNKLVYSLEDFTDIIIFQLSGILIESIWIVIVVSQANLLFWLLFWGFILWTFLFQYFMQKWRAKFEIQANKSDSKMSGFLSDTISNSINIKVFASRKKELASFTTIANTWQKDTKKSWFSSVLIFAIMGIFIISFEVSTLYFAIDLRGKWLISVGVIVLLQAYIIRIIRQLFFIWNTLKRLTAIIGKSAEMIEILDSPLEIKDCPNAKKLKIKNAEIKFEKVGFNYNKEEDAVFSNLNIKIKPGERVAFVGESGAGKTSIIKLLMRFYDIQKGNILIDGQNIAKVSQESLRDSISLVPQEPILFHRTLKENIAYGRPHASDEEIFAAARMAKCERFIKKLEKGYDTMVGERGIKLSWWERQRVAIARAILENKSILLLDEATSALDSESEILIQEAMQEVMKNKTVIVIAHRLSTIMNMDRIIVLEQGEVIETGSHKELMGKKNGKYAHLWDIQSGGFLGE